MSHQQPPDLQNRWNRHLRRSAKTTGIWACSLCIDRRICHSSEELWRHAREWHRDKIPPSENEDELREFRTRYEAESSQNRTIKDDAKSRKPSYNDAATSQPEPPPSQSLSKRPLFSSSASTLTVGGLQRLDDMSLGPNEPQDTPMRDVDDVDSNQPRKRAAMGDGISGGSMSPYRDADSPPPPRRSNIRPTSSFDLEIQRPHVSRGQGQLWNPDSDAVPPRIPFDPSNIGSMHAHKSKSQVLQQKTRVAFPASLQIARQQPNQASNQTLGSKNPISSNAIDDVYAIILQPETRPISQEQLVAEVKGIYAGLVMVEAKCIEVDNKQAALAQADGTHSKLNNEQWQALIALHRTLLHEHHDFFLASQHPSASPALRRLASKYAMPARMWRHGIHSFLELLRHRLPASLDHMLAFIYLAYSMMALLYETVPAFEDTWIECLGDLGRYRMAIEDDDIRDREVWTGVARHWYSKASDKAPTTGRLYHHLAILARPNALQQLFYYTKSLCVVVPFTSARDSVLTLFEPVLNADNGQGQYRLPPLETAFIKAHGLLFTNRAIEKFKPAVLGFIELLDTQIGRVTRKFMEQGYQIAVANCVAMLGFAAKDNPLMKAISPSPSDGDLQMSGASSNELSLLMLSFKNAEFLSNSTLRVVLHRIGDPNVLPFIHIMLVFMLRMSRHSAAMGYLQSDFPWDLLAIMLNTLLATYVDSSPSRIESNKFPSVEKDEAQPFPEDFALRGLLWADKYFPDDWFSNDRIDEEEKYHERASMTEQRKERILWLSCQISNAGSGLCYDSTKCEFSAQVESLGSRSSTFASEASATTSATTLTDRTETWPLDTGNDDISDDDAT